MKKGIAVPYIVAILLGIVVIGLIGYWFYVTGGKWGATVSEVECKAKLSEYCSKWALTGYANTTAGKPKVSEGKFADCMDEAIGCWFNEWVFEVYKIDCAQFNLISITKVDEARRVCRGY